MQSAFKEVPLSSHHGTSNSKTEEDNISFDHCFPLQLVDRVLDYINQIAFEDDIIYGRKKDVAFTKNLNSFQNRKT